MEYSEEHLNFFRVCHITANIITSGLRIVFRQEWDVRYKTTLGEWKDTLTNGQDFERLETPASKKKNSRLLNIMKNGNSREWDCTALFFGILFSSSIGTYLNPTVKSHADDLRSFRNEIFAHISKGTISDTDFQALIGRVETAFLELGLPVSDIKAIANQKIIPTKEWRLLKDQLIQEQEEVRALQEKSSALEEELKSSPKTFLGILSTKPSHVIQERSNDVATILEQMERLRMSSNGEISTMYLSGNPGCGKSQIARMVGEAYFKQVTGSELVFVTTLNAENQEALFNSYDSLSRALGCTVALTIFRGIHGEKHGDVAECLNNLGSVKVNLFYHEEASQYYQDALSISRELFGTKHLTVARCLHNLGVSFLHGSHYDDAERCLEEALAIQVEICGEKQERVAVSLSNLGRLHLKCSRFKKARQFMERALSIRLEMGNQLRVGRILYHLGSLSENEGNITTAADYYSQALQTIRRQYEFLPENHLYVSEAVEALQRTTGTTEAQNTMMCTMIKTKRKAEELTTDITGPQRSIKMVKFN